MLGDVKAVNAEGEVVETWFSKAFKEAAKGAELSEAGWVWCLDTLWNLRITDKWPTRTVDEGDSRSKTAVGEPRQGEGVGVV